MKRNKKTSYIATVKGLWKVIKPYKNLYFISSALAIMLVLTTILQARFTQSLVDGISNNKTSTLSITLIGFFVVIMLSILFNYLQGVSVAKLSANSSTNLKRNISHSLLYTKYPEINNQKSGDTLSTVNTDIQSVCTFLNKDLSELFSNFVMAVGTLTYILCVNWALGIVTFIFMPIGILAGFYLNKKATVLYSKMADVNGEALSSIEQMLMQIPIIKSFMMEKQIYKRIYASCEVLRNTKMKATVMQGIQMFVGSATIQIPRIVYLLFGGYLVINGQFTLGAMIAIMDLLSYVIYPTSSISNILTGLNKSMAALNRIEKLTSLPLEVPKTTESNCELKIDVNSITFGYDDENAIFENFSFHYDGAGIIALCGKSGSGKTTLLDLLTGLYSPKSGHINISSEISVVTQDTYIFAETLLENVKMAKSDATEDEVMEALSLSGAEQFAKELPDGIYTVLGDGNKELSGGQKQRIALARTILRDSPIWLLDEPTSALDPETEQIIIDNINTQRTTKLILISAHRQSLIDLADRKVVLS